MSERWRPRRSPTRFLAPLALAAAIGGTYVVIHHALHGDSSSSGGHLTHASSSDGAKGSSGTTPKTTTRRSARRIFYTVKPGDNLSTISARTGIPLPDLETLNPKVSSGSLQVGQRLRLRR